MRLKFSDILQNAYTLWATGQVQELEPSIQASEYVEYFEQVEQNLNLKRITAPIIRLSASFYDDFYSYQAQLTEKALKIYDSLLENSTTSDEEKAEIYYELGLIHGSSGNWCDEIESQLKCYLILKKITQNEEFYNLQSEKELLSLLKRCHLYLNYFENSASCEREDLVNIKVILTTLRTLLHSNASHTKYIKSLFSTALQAFIDKIEMYCEKVKLFQEELCGSGVDPLSEMLKEDLQYRTEWNEKTPTSRHPNPFLVKHSTDVDTDLKISKDQRKGRNTFKSENEYQRYLARQQQPYASQLIHARSLFFGNRKDLKRFPLPTARLLLPKPAKPFLKKHPKQYKYHDKTFIQDAIKKVKAPFDIHRLVKSSIISDVLTDSYIANYLEKLFLVENTIHQTTIQRMVNPRSLTPPDLSLSESRDAEDMSLESSVLSDTEIEDFLSHDVLSRDHKGVALKSFEKRELSFLKGDRPLPMIQDQKNIQSVERTSKRKWNSLNCDRSLKLIEVIHEKQRNSY